MDGWRYSPPQKPWLEVLHHDRDLLLLNKPSGLLSVPGRDPAHRDSALARAQDVHGTLYAVHRLDMDTSGLLLLASRRRAERAVMAQFQDRSVHKRYEARVWGHVAQDQGCVELALRREIGRPRSVVDVHGKPARTEFSVLSRDADGTTRLSLTPRTGRSHQLRVHLLAIGHPILGDRFYGHADSQGAAVRLCLHAAELRLRHPYTGEWMRFEAPIPF